MVKRSWPGVGLSGGRWEQVGVGEQVDRRSNAMLGLGCDRHGVMRERSDKLGLQRRAQRTGLLAWEAFEMAGQGAETRRQAHWHTGC